jgi:hypothetical protein
MLIIERSVCGIKITLVTTFMFQPPATPYASVLPFCIQINSVVRIGAIVICSANYLAKQFLLVRWYGNTPQQSSEVVQLVLITNNRGKNVLIIR